MSSHSRSQSDSLVQARNTASSNTVDLEMTTFEIPYSVLVNTENEDYVAIESYDFSTISVDTRHQWGERIIQDLQSGRSGLQAIRACKIVLHKDGTADVDVAPTLPPKICRYVYPTRFRIPPAAIVDLPLEEQVGRAENFAFGSLLYHIHSGHRPFDNLPDEYVEARFASAEIPDDVLSLDQWPLILSCWSFEFARDLNGSIPCPSPFPFRLMKLNPKTGHPSHINSLSNIYNQKLHVSSVSATTSNLTPTLAPYKPQVYC